MMKQDDLAQEQYLPRKPLQEFLHRLASVRGTRLESRLLWEYFRDAFPYRPGGAENRRWLLMALQEAVDQGIIRLPSLRGNCWDRTVEPPLPTIVWKIQPHKIQRDESWREYPWLPQLAWVSQMATLSQEYELFLKRVQQALREGELQRLAPMKYRSLQLTGNEKRLGELIHTPLFQPGRLSLALLGCVPDVPPLALEEMRESHVALVFENAAAFRTASQVLKQYQHPPYGMLGFGGGRGFERSILHFQFIERHISRIEYVGDLDRPGLHIARGAERLAQREGLPPVLPARGLHRAMLASIRQFGYPEGLEYQDRERRNDPDDEELVSWLPEDVRLECLTIIRAGKRIPEEVLGPDELQRVWQEVFDAS
jgi:hypothetical protein